jgi:hypothetical protein
VRCVRFPHLSDVCAPPMLCVSIMRAFVHLVGEVSEGLSPRLVHVYCVWCWHKALAQEEEKDPWLRWLAACVAPTNTRSQTQLLRLNVFNRTVDVQRGEAHHCVCYFSFFHSVSAGERRAPGCAFNKLSQSRVTRFGNFFSFQPLTRGAFLI